MLYIITCCAYSIEGGFGRHVAHPASCHLDQPLSTLRLFICEGGAACVVVCVYLVVLFELGPFNLNFS
jgi:hypothetical protein